MNCKITTTTLALTLCGLPAGMIHAQDDDGPAGYSYVTYYVCDVATQSNMDSVVETHEKPVFDEWVESGKLSGWGYLSHFTGGRWRRAQYHVSETLEGALETQSKIFAEIYSDNREAGQARAEACEAHDDYIWALQQGSPPGTGRGPVSLSVYSVCSVADQARADDIFREVYAPKLDEYVKDGRISSWSWQSHVLGGRYRRLQTVTGDDFAAVSTARFDAIRYVDEKHPALGREFAGICDEHSDYLWNIVHESP